MKQMNMEKSIVLSDLKVEICFSDLKKMLRTSGNFSDLLKITQSILEKLQGKWKPAVLYQWFAFEIDETGSGCILNPPGDPVVLNMGHSLVFLEPAKTVMIGTCTIGKELDIASADANNQGDFLDAYLIDLIGLTALKKTEDIMKNHAQIRAQKQGWGVSLHLSPGSVHGWSLEEQLKLCALLPIDKINVIISPDAVLFPHKSITALIGIGPGYKSKKVGNTCKVCTKRDTCQMNFTEQRGSDV